jgi:hypothetical protein
MSKWIKINLPWYKEYESKTRCPAYPFKSVEKKVIKKFGKTRHQLCDDFRKKFKHEFYEVIRKAREKESFSDEIEDDVLLSYPSGKSPALKAAVKLRKTVKEIIAFEDSVPETVKWNEKSQKISNEVKLETDKISFSRSKLCRPGVLIEVKNEDKTEQYLIGNINVNGGGCDCCTYFDGEAIVLRAKVVWGKE